MIVATGNDIEQTAHELLFKAILKIQSICATGVRQDKQAAQNALRQIHAICEWAHTAADLLRPEKSGSAGDLQFYCINLEKVISRLTGENAS